jgi:hypothetical protein
MRYNISYEDSKTLKLEDFIKKIQEHTELFNSYFGNEWAYTGSCAVILYILKYSSTDLIKISPPNDIDILIQSRQPISNRRIGDYDTKIQSTLEKSVTYENSINKNSIDITSVPKLRPFIIGDNPVLNLDILLDYYQDDLTGYREKDIPKIEILMKIKKIINDSVSQATSTNRAEDEERSNRFGGLSKSLF